jgi:tetratricopeptide (TPR) repeat protein
MSFDKTVYSAQQLAQRLSNRAAFFIETGRPVEAIPMLARAMKLVEQEPRHNACSCKHCSLEECLILSQQVQHLARRDSWKQSGLSSCDEEQQQLAGGYIHRQPILVTQQSMQPGHSLGMALHVILSFNLALAYQLRTVEKTINRNELQKALRLYELAYMCQIKEQERDEQVCSVRFTIIILNNLGEIHRNSGSRKRYVMCLHQLLSTLMFVVDCHENEEDSIELEGFFRNTSQLILQESCACAA